MEKVILFLFGAALGSAGNALIDRLPRNESWLSGYSHCDKCKRRLVWYDLIPVFSYIWLLGKCRHCHSPIPYRNLLMEMVSGILAVKLVTTLNLVNVGLFLAVWASLALAVMDWETRMVSESLVLFWGVLNLINGFSFVGGLWGMGIIGVIWAGSKGKAMGFGDVEIALVMGFSLGWQKLLVALWIAFVSGALYGLGLVWMGRARIKSLVAFGPFLILGYWAAYFWGGYLLKYFWGYV